MADKKRLIDANRASNAIAGIHKRTNSPSEAETVALITIAQQPTVDAVEVVRCKDCKHWINDALWCNVNNRDRNKYFNWYEDDSLWFYGKIRSKLVRAKSPKQAMERFQKLYGIKPLEAKL